MNYWLVAFFVIACITSVRSQTPVQLMAHVAPETKSKSVVKKSKALRKKLRKKKKAQKSKVVRSDFELVGGLIFLKANLNGEQQDFVFDTGSAHLLLNSKKEIKKNKGYVINGIGGSKKVKKIYNPDFYWNGIRPGWEPAFSLDFSHIEKTKGRSIGGLIGYDLIKNKEIAIDYKNSLLYLIPKSNKTFFEGQTAEDKIPFYMCGHIPVIQIKIGRKTFYFGIDTGAEVNVFNKKIKNKIPEELFTFYNNSSIIGTNKKIEKIEVCKISSIKVGNSEYQNMPFALADISHLQTDRGIQLDGLLGYPFLKKANFSINYRKRKLCKWGPTPLNAERKEIVISEGKD